jgi:hypothetical protein
MSAYIQVIDIEMIGLSYNCVYWIDHDKNILYFWLSGVLMLSHESRFILQREEFDLCINGRSFS